MVEFGDSKIFFLHYAKPKTSTHFMKKLFLPAMLFAALSLVSCGGSGSDSGSDSADKDSTPAEAPKASFADVCKDASKMSVTIKGYKYQMSGDYEYAADFVVKDSKLTWSNDSSAVLVLKNYKPEELVGDRKDDQIDITVELSSRHGKKSVRGLITTPTMIQISVHQQL